MPEREMVSVPREYLEALEALPEEMRDIGDTQVRHEVYPQTTLANLFSFELARIEAARPKPPDPNDVLRRIVDFWHTLIAEDMPLSKADTLWHIQDDARRIIDAHQSETDKDGQA